MAASGSRVLVGSPDGGRGATANERKSHAGHEHSVHLLLDRKPLGLVPRVSLGSAEAVLGIGDASKLGLAQTRLGVAAVQTSESMFAISWTSFCRAAESISWSQAA